MEKKQADEVGRCIKQLEQITGFSWKVKTSARQDVPVFKICCSRGPVGLGSPVMFSVREMYVWMCGFMDGFADGKGIK